jgi:hypothetical protein
MIDNFHDDPTVEMQESDTMVRYHDPNMDAAGNEPQGQHEKHVPADYSVEGRIPEQDEAKDIVQMSIEAAERSSTLEPPIQPHVHQETYHRVDDAGQVVNGRLPPTFQPMTTFVEYPGEDPYHRGSQVHIIFRCITLYYLILFIHIFHYFSILFFF